MAGLPFPLQPHQDSGKSLVTSSTQLHHIIPGELLKAVWQSTLSGDPSERAAEAESAAPVEPFACCVN